MPLAQLPMFPDASIVANFGAMGGCVACMSGAEFGLLGGSFVCSFIHPSFARPKGPARANRPHCTFSSGSLNLTRFAGKFHLLLAVSASALQFVRCEWCLT